MSDEFDIDDGFDSFDDFDAPNFDGEVGGGNETRTPITAAASSFTQAATNELLSVNAAQKVLRRGLPEGYGQAVDLVDEVAGEAADLYDKAERRLEPAIKATKEATKGLLPKAEGILPKSVYEKIGEWADDSGGNGPSVNADEESISTALSSIFTTQMEQSEQARQEEGVKDTLKEQVAGKRHEQSQKSLGLIQQAMSRLVGYQDSVTIEYQKKSLDLQFRHYFAARDLLKLQTASNADVITALNDIKTNTGLPDWVKTENSENFQSLLQERLMGGTVETIGDYMTNFRSNFFKNISNKVMDTVDSVADGVEQMASGVIQMNDASDMMAGMDDGPKESGVTAATGFAGEMAGGSAANWVVGRLAKALRSESGKEKAVAEQFMRLSNFVNGVDGWTKERLDKVDETDGILGSVGGWFKDALPTMRTQATVLNNLSTDATASVEWDLLSRRTLIEIIPEYLARITQNTETMATGKPAEKVVFSKTSESFVTERQAIAEATDKFVKRKDIEDYRERSDNLMKKLFGSAKISDEARAVMSEQVHLDLEKGWNFDPRRYVETGAFEDRFDRDAVGELQQFLRDKFNATDKGEHGKEDWKFELSEQSEKLIGQLQTQGRGLRNAIPEMQSAINQFVATGDKDLLRATGWIDSTSGTDTFNKDRMDALMSGRLQLDDLESEYDREQMRAKRGEDKTKWRDQDQANWKVEREIEESYRQGGYTAESTSTPFKFDANDRDVMNGLAEAMSNLTGVNADQLKRLTELTLDSTKGQEHNDEQLKILTEIRDLMLSRQMGEFSAEDAALGQELLKKFTAMANWEQPKWYDTLASGFKGAATAGAGMLGNYYSAIGTGIGKGWEFAKEKTGGAWDFLNAKKDSIDVYISGKMTPALRGELIKAGRYLDQTTGKVITSLSDINGVVIDQATGNVVLTQEDFDAGIYNDTGESIIDKLGVGAQRLATGAADMLGNYYGFLGDTAKKVWAFGKEKIVGYDRKLKNQTDVYVKSRMGDGPVLLRTKLIAGEYFDADGNPIYQIQGLDHPVYDSDGNMLITHEDLSAGLVDPEGNEIRTAGLLGTGLGIAGLGLKFAADTGAKAWDALKGYYSGIGNMSKGFLETVKEGFNFGGIGNIGTMNVTATTVIVNGAVKTDGGVETAPSTPKDAGPSMGEKLKDTAEAVMAKTEVAATVAKDKVSEKADEVAEYVSGTKAYQDFSNFDAKAKVDEIRTALNEENREETLAKLREKSEQARDLAADKASKKVDEVTEKVKEKTPQQILDAVEAVKSTDFFNKPMGGLFGLGNKEDDELVGKEVGEGTVMVADSEGNVSIKSGQDIVPAGDGTVKGYLASLLAYFTNRDKLKAGDTDGDGFRDGSWRDQLAKDKAGEGEDGSGGDKPKEGESKPGSGLMSKLAAMLGFGGGDDDSGGEDGSFLEDVASEVAGDKISDALGGDGDSGEGRERTKRKPGGKKRDRMGKAWDAIKSGGSKLKDGARSLKGQSTWGKAKTLFKGAAKGITGVGGLVSGLGTSVAGRAAASSGLKKAALWGLRGALGLVGGTLGAPMVGTALAAAGAAYTAYEIFGAFRDREGTEPLEEYRFVQYGIDPGSMSQRNFIRKLERGAKDYIQYSGREGTSNSLDINDIEFFDDMMALVDIDTNNPEHAQRFSEWMTWFNNRFKPVFLLHHGVARMLDKDVDLLDIDDELDDSQKSPFVRGAYFANDGSGQSPYLVHQSPFEEEVSSVGYDQIDEMKESLNAEYKEDEEDRIKGTETDSGDAWAAPVGGTTAAVLSKKTGQSKGMGTEKTGKTEESKLSKVMGAAMMAVPAVGLLATAYKYFAGNNDEVELDVPTVTGNDGKDIPHLDALRFYQYGVEKLTWKGADALYQLEREIGPEFQIANSKVKWSGSHDRVWNSFHALFGYEKNDYEGKRLWMKWFVHNFIGVYGTYLAGLRKKSITEIDRPRVTKVAAWEIGEVLGRRYKPTFTGEWMKDSESEPNEEMVFKLLKVLERDSKVKDEEHDVADVGKNKSSGTDAIANVQMKSSVPEPNPERDTEAKAAAPTSTPTDVKRKLQASKSGKKGGKGFIIPSSGSISSPYGDRVHPIDGTKKFHGGIDIAAPVGSDVLASSGGTISRREFSRSYGNVIYVENDDGTHSRYAHMYRFEPGFRVGDRVEQGVKIGEVGSTGNSTGPHLHFEIRKDKYNKKSALDPLALFSGKEGTKAKESVAEAIKAVEEEKVGDTTMEGVNTIASTVTGKPTKSHDEKRVETARTNTPLVEPAKMVPTTPVAEPKVDYHEDAVATKESEPEVAVAKEPPKLKPRILTPPPVEAVRSNEPTVEREVIEQRRAQLNQEAAHATSTQQLADINNLMSNQLQTQKRIEELLVKVAENTKSTADLVGKPQTVVLEGGDKSATKTAKAKPMTGNQLGQLFKSTGKQGANLPLSMGRRS